MLAQILELAKLGEQHVEGRHVLGVQLEHRPFKILHGVSLTVQVAILLELLGNWIALLGEAAVPVPVKQELTLYVLAGLGE